MINNEKNFFELVYDIFYKFAQTTPESIGFAFSRKIQYPLIEFLPELQVVIPLPKKQDEMYVFEGLVFDNTENGRKSMWGLFLATIYHMAAHACMSEYSIYGQWRKNKTQEICHKVIDFIEDVSVEKYITHTSPEIWANMKNINSKLLSFEKNDRQKINTNEIHDKLNSFLMSDNEKKVERIRTEIIKKIEEADHHKNLLLFADLLYKNRELLPGNILPYCEHHNYYTIIKTEKKCIEFEPFGEEFEENISYLDQLWISNEQSKIRLIKRYKKHLKNLNFDTIIIPTGNLHQYLQIKSKTLHLLRRIRQQLRMVTNLTDDPRIDQIGYVDMQMAIQAIAGEGQSQDIFEHDELRRGDEAWAILVDKSASMKLRFEKIKEFIVCISESANELTGKSDAWALYSFDNNFQILKDFKEKYNREVQARIGSLENGGLSLLPDAIELANRILAEDPRERKYLFIITDGNPSGYERIQEMFSKIVKKTEASSTTLIAIGVSKGVTKQFRNSVRGNDLKQLVAKFITTYKTIASSD